MTDSRRGPRPKVARPAAGPFPGYEVESRLAVGGLSEVFIVRSHSGGDGLIAVAKKALRDPDGLAVQCIERERAALVAIDSPHLPRLIGSGADYLVIEHIDGVDLGRLLQGLRKRGKKLSIGAGLALVAALAQAVASVHEAGYVHADVTPANVLVTASGEVRLIDLGLATTIEAAARQPSGGHGTVAYMAPEQLRGEAAGPLADLFSLGLCAYEAFTGMPARPAGLVGLSELLEARRALPTAPSALRRQLPASSDAALLAALQPRGEARPEGAQAWLADVLDAFEGFSADPAALGNAAAPLVSSPRPLGRAERTAAALLGPSPAAAPERRLLPALALGVLATGLVLVAGLALWQGGGGSPSAPNSVVAESPSQGKVLATLTTDAVQPWRGPDASSLPSPTEDAGPNASDVVGVSDISNAPGPGPDSGLAAEVRVSSQDDSSSQESDAGPKPAPPERAPRVRVSTAGSGAIYVSGGGARGAAPTTTKPLPVGSTALKISGGGLRVTVRLSRGKTAGGALRGRVSAGRVSRAVRCGSRKGHTPMSFSLRKSIKCSIVGDAGKRLSFALRVK